MQKKRKLGRGVAVVGAGMSKFGMFKDKDSRDLLVDAYDEMLSSVDKGVDPRISRLYGWEISPTISSSIKDIGDL